MSGRPSVSEIYSAFEDLDGVALENLDGGSLGLLPLTGGPGEAAASETSGQFVVRFNPAEGRAVRYRVRIERIDD